MTTPRYYQSPNARCQKRFGPDRPRPLAALNDKIEDVKKELVEHGDKVQLQYLHPTKGWQAARPRKENT